MEDLNLYIDTICKLKGETRKRNNKLRNQAIFFTRDKIFKTFLKMAL